jgi:hypothetical protein
MGKINTEKTDFNHLSTSAQTALALGVVAIVALSVHASDLTQAAATPDHSSPDIVKVSSDHNPHIHSDLVVDRRHIIPARQEEERQPERDSGRENWAIYEKAA